ncbi:hypothetical protein G7Y89_g7285 [Cudoniella acicularis]|uniref:Cytochrome P450 n=1 Tax=Cudoniella acicularis TaxID=354080 RepID=A0A8H4RIU3_9HELO|nr:hypothetical protein G7Y89_g7285 [Cudoniella acicularis]
MSFSTYLLSACTLIAVIAFSLSRRSKLDVKRVGRDPGFFGLNSVAAKKEFATNGHHLVEAGYYELKNENFVVQTQDMERLVISPKYLPELRMLPETKLSHSRALVERFVGWFSSVDIVLQNHQHSDVCRLQLTQNLPNFLPEMATELGLATSQFLEKCPVTSEDYTQFPTYGYVYSMVLAISSRVFVSLPLARDQAWHDTVSAYLANVVETANALRPWPKALRPFIRHLVAPKSRMANILANAKEILVPAIEERQALDHKQSDVLGFLVETSEVVDPTSIILKVLVLLAAALHTSTMAAVHALFDLCEMPEYLEKLRKEAREALAEDGGSWKFSTMKKLRQLDSFMKESMRINQPETFSFGRIVVSPVTLSNGLKIPTGTYISMAAEAMSRDPTYYEDPHTFKGDRFFKNSPSKETQPLDDFTGIEPGNLAWGSGRLTCPGRWYGTTMIKLIVGSLLAEYEIKFPEGQTKRPPNLYNNGSIMPDPTQQLLLRKLK